MIKKDRKQYLKAYFLLYTYCGKYQETLDRVLLFQKFYKLDVSKTFTAKFEKKTKSIVADRHVLRRAQ